MQVTTRPSQDHHQLTADQWHTQTDSSKQAYRDPKGQTKHHHPAAKGTHNDGWRRWDDDDGDAASNSKNIRVHAKEKKASSDPGDAHQNNLPVYIYLSHVPNGTEI
jgi:hypothetical protein